MIPDFFTPLGKFYRCAFWPLMRLVVILSIIFSTPTPSIQAASSDAPVQHPAGDTQAQVETTTPMPTATQTPTDILFCQPKSTNITSTSSSFFDDFNGTALDLSRWTVVGGVAAQQIGGGLLQTSGSPDHKEVSSISVFIPGPSGVQAQAHIRLAGNYQKFGFNVNYAASGSGIYFDTLDAGDGGEVNYIHALIWCVPETGQLVNLLDAKIPVTWFEFHDFEIQWLPTEVIFLIDAHEVARVAFAFGDALPIGIWNHRASLMQTDWIKVDQLVASTSTPAPTDTYTPTAADTSTETPSRTLTPTPSPTTSATDTPTATSTPTTPTSSPSPTVTATSSPTPTSLNIFSSYYVDSIRTSLAISATAQTLSVANTSGFAAGDEVLVMSMQGDQAGQSETAYLDSVSANTLELRTSLAHVYDVNAGPVMVQRIPHFGAVTVKSGGNLTAHAWDGTTGGVVFFRAETLTVDNGGRISADGQGYVGQPGNGSGPGGGIGAVWGGATGGGGSYGGVGGTSYFYGGGTAYGSVKEPTTLGSAGGSGEYNGWRYGGNGGGAIRLVVAGTLTVNGTLSANGDPATYYRAGGGSGGSLWITANAVAGDGLIQTNGGSGGGGGCCSAQGGGGAGGRIALEYTTSTMALDANHLQAIGGWGQQYGGPGTVFLQQTTGDLRGSVLVDNNDQVSQFAVLPSGPAHDFASVSLSRGGNLQAQITASGVMTFSIINVGANSTLLLMPSNNSNADYTDEAPFVLNTTTVTIDEGGHISSDGQGYIGQGDYILDSTSPLTYNPEYKPAQEIRQDA